MEKWGKYFQPNMPYLDKVIFKAIADDTVRETGLKTDEMQWVMQVPLQKVEELKNESDIKVTVGKPYLPDFIYINASKPPFDDARVRHRSRYPAVVGGGHRTGTSAAPAAARRDLGCRPETRPGVCGR